MKRTIESVLAELRQGKTPSLLLLHGDDYRLHAASKALLDLLVPSENRDFHLERFDGHAAPWEEIEAALMTPPFLSGKKTVVIENAPYFISREQRGELAAKIFRLWAEGKKSDAARLLADLLVLEGWTEERWERLKESGGGELAALLDAEEAEAAQRAEELLAFCRAGGLTLSRRQGGEGQRLFELLESGPPPWAVLLIIAPQVDRRTRLYKLFEEKAWVLDLGVEKDRSGRISRELLTEQLDRRLKEVGKKADAQAREMILARAGEELWGFHQELEKLFLYLGAEPRIRAEDVEEIISDQGEGWVFDLLKAIAERKPVAALAHLERLLSQGDQPLKILGTIAGEVRRLLGARALIEHELKGKWTKEMSYPQFQRELLPDGPPPGQNPYRYYMTFKSAENFTTQELIRALRWIHGTDQRLKSSGPPPRLAMERLILEMCRKQ